MTRGRPSRSTIYQRLDAALDDLRQRFGGLPTPSESVYVWRDIWHLEAHHSTALEGNTLVLKEVERLLDRAQAVGAKPLKEYLEVKGYAEAAEWVYAQASSPNEGDGRPLVSVQEVRNIHHVAMTPVWSVAPHPDASDQESPGNFRRHELHPFAEAMQPPTWPLVPAALEDWVTRVHDLLGGPTDETRPLTERLAEAHCAFERVHPFIDGNGRTGRLVLNLMLVRLGYPPVVILKQQRPHYLTALGRADQGDYGPLGELLARAMTDNLHRFILPSIAGPARLIPLAALVDADLSLVALRRAAARGRLDAQQGADGIWLSSRRAVEDYKQSRLHAGPRQA